MPVNDEILVRTDSVELVGNLHIPRGADGLVVFAHGSGSSRQSSRNRFVAKQLNNRGLGTLLFDLLTEEEEIIDNETRRLRFDIELLAERVTGTVDFVRGDHRTKGLQVGLFGASTGAAAALIAAHDRPEAVKAVVSRGGRPDLAKFALPQVQAATLLIVGKLDKAVIELNETAFKLLKTSNRKIEIVDGATHLFEEPGKLEEVARLAGEWFQRALKA